MEIVGVAGSNLQPSGMKMNQTRPDHTPGAHTLPYAAPVRHSSLTLNQSNCLHRFGKKFYQNFCGKINTSTLSDGCEYLCQKLFKTMLRPELLYASPHP